MNTRLYVGNLSFQTSEAAIRDHFTGLGEITDVHVVMDRYSGQPRGFAFVTMSTPQQASAAIAKLDGAVVDGRPLRVNQAEERSNQADGRRGGFQRRQ